MANPWERFAVFADAAQNEAAMKKAADEAGVKLTRGDADAIVEIARQRAELLQRVEDALLADDQATAVRLMRQYCGIDLEEDTK